MKSFFFALIAFSIALLPAERFALAVSADLYEQPGPIDAVNLLSRPYAYTEKTEFVNAVTDRLAFFSEAINNWRTTPSTAKDEAKSYAKTAEEKIAPLLETAQAALKRASSASEKDWQDAQAESRKTLLVTMRAYQDMHNNR